MNKKYFKYLCFGIFIIATTTGKAQVVSQKIGNNPVIITESAALEVESTNKGVLIPRIALTSTVDATTINTPATSLFIYNTSTAGTAPNDVTPGFYYWNGTSWTKIATGNALVSEVDGIIGNEVTDAVANGGLTRSGSGTTANPYKLKINDGTVNGQLLTWDGSKWIAQNAPTEVDAIIGNEVTDAMTNGGLTRSGTGTVSDPYKLKINDGTVNGQLLTWDGSKWIAQTAAPQWALEGNVGTDPSTNFIGTADAKDLSFRTNNTEKVRVLSNGNIGIGTTAPVSRLDIIGSIGLPTVASTTNITLDTSHAVVRVDTTAGDVTITLPAATAATNRIYSVVKTDVTANKLIFSATINGIGYTFTQANIPGEYKIQSDGTSWNVLK